MRIYIYVPANVYTGGPTALFDLCHILNEYYHVDAWIAFYGITDGDPVHPNYKKYKCKWTLHNNVNDDKTNIIVVPESVPSILNQFNNARKVVYFLSVDYYVLAGSYLKNWKGRLQLYSREARLLWRDMLELLKDRSILRYHYPEIVSSIVKNLVENRLVKLPGDVDLYLAQSRYVVEFLRRYGVPWENIILLHEPLEEEFIKSALDANLPAKKENAVAWNKRKSNTVGYKLAKLLRDRFKVYELFNVGKEKMVDILSRTKVFIDIGWHPGRDRPPREAVAMWNVPLVNNHGGLYYYEDYPVPHKYKIDCYDICNKVSYKELVDRVIDFVENYDAHIKVFEDFRRYIVEEPELFVKDVGMLVKRLGV